MLTSFEAGLRRSSSLLTALALPLVLACADTNREAQPAESGERAETATPAAEPAPPAATPAGDVEGGAMTDAQIKDVIATVNKGEIDLAKVAIQKAQNPDVKAFAQRMENEHSALNTQAQVTTGGAGAVAQNELISTLEADAQATLKDLQSRSDAEFDLAYIDSQVRMHRTVLGALEDRLIPSAQDPELRKVLEGARESVQDHLSQAEEIRDQLAA